MSVIPGEGRVPILYGHQPMAIAPHRDGYVARPDAVAPHPAVAVAVGDASVAAGRTLAQHLARHGYAVVVPPSEGRQLEAAVDAFGVAWSEWSRGDLRALIGIGSGAAMAAEVAGSRGLPLILLSPEPIVATGGGGPVLVLGPGALPSAVQARRVAYRGAGAGFWDDTATDYDPAAASDALRRMVEFLDRHLGAVVAA